MNKKILFLLLSLLVITILIIGGIYFLRKVQNRTASADNVGATSTVSGLSLTFHMTPLFADFLYDRGLWNANAVRLNKQKPGQTVSKMAITLKDKTGYRGTKDPALPIIVASTVTQSPDGKSNTYMLDIFVDSEYVKRYKEKDLEKNIFLAVLSQIYEDTAKQITSYEERVSKSDVVSAVANKSDAVPLVIKRTN